MGFLRLPILSASLSSDCWVCCLLHRETGIAVILSVGGGFVVGVGDGRVVGGGGGQ